jgi:hypothetical protein
MKAHYIGSSLTSIRTASATLYFRYFRNPSFILLSCVDAKSFEAMEGCGIIVSQTMAHNHETGARWRAAANTFLAYFAKKCSAISAWL